MKQSTKGIQKSLCKSEEVPILKDRKNLRKKSGFAVLLLAANLETHAGWFQTPEQRAIHDFQRGDYEIAASNFADPYRKGVALYRAGKYQEASTAFAQSKRPEVLIDALYNQGNSEYQRKEYARAIVLYERVLTAESDHEDARHNLALAKSHLVLYHCPPTEVEPRKEDKKEQETKKEKKDKDKEESQKESKQDQKGKDPKDQDKKDQDKKDLEKKPQEQKSKDEQKNEKKEDGKKSEDKNKGSNQENSPGKGGQDSDQKVGTKNSQDTGESSKKSGEDSSGQEWHNSKFEKDGNHEKSTGSLEKTKNETEGKEISKKNAYGEGTPKKIGKEQSDPNGKQGNGLGKEVGEVTKSLGGEEVSIKEGLKEQEAHILHGDPEKLGSAEKQSKDPPSQGVTSAERPMDLQSTETVSRLEKLASGTSQDSKTPQGSSFENLDEVSGEKGAGISDALAKQWMSRVEADPGRILRRQFEVEERRELVQKNGQILEIRPW